MDVYVAGAMCDADLVRRAQAAIVAAGHRITWDWTSGAEAGLSSYGEAPDRSARIALTDLQSVLDADAVVVVVGVKGGLGMYVELGAALACAQLGSGMRVALVGHTLDQSVFFFHPAVDRFASVEAWLATL